MKKKVIVSFSGGKDSTLALHRVLKSEEYEPVALMITINKSKEESWFHNISIEHLKKVSFSLGIPLLLVECTSETYKDSFEKVLETVKMMEVEGCVFGDIDIEEHRTWCTERCSGKGMEAIFPLWQEEREKLVKEFVNLGYKAIIKKIDLEKVPETFLGKTLSLEVIEELKTLNIDVCGENGEYHTFVYDGPTFSKRIEIEQVGIEKNGKTGVLLVK